MFRFSILPASAGALAIAIAAPASAQTGRDLDSAAGAAGDVIVTANRTARPADEVAQSVTVIAADEIRRRQSQTVVDLLRTVPGVTFTRNGGPGTATGVNIRGADSDQNVVLIDGVKLNDPSSTGSGYNFGNLLVGNIERIEVVRGSQSVIWGSQAIGGVVNLLTAAPTDALRINARAEGGWRDTYQAFGNVSARVGPVAASAGAGYFRTDGISALDEKSGGRERDGFDNFGVNARALIDLTDTVSIDLRGFYSDGEADVDGFPAPAFAFADTREGGKTRELVGYGGVNATLLGGRFRNRFAFAYTRTERTNIDPDGAIRTTFDAQGENERFEYQGVVDLDPVDATFGAETETSRYVSASFGGAPAGADVRISSVYGEASVKPFAGGVLTGGVRHDDHQTFGDATTFAASGVYSPNGGATRLRAAYGEGFKAPSLFQLYSNFGNTTLAPERSESWEVGIGQRFGGRVDLAATYFHRNTENQIDFISCTRNPAAICVGRPSGTYDNIRLTRAQGVELSATLRPIDRFTLRGQYSFIDARNRLNRLQLARRPRQTVSVIADYAFDFGLQAGATLAHVGDSFDNAANTSRLDGYVLADIRAAYPIGQGIELFGRIENLFDEKYETILGYGTLGRAAYAGVRLKI
ncbi:TonB-dependent receptor plug domain-containing protein [Sphingomonas sp.]|jgi:vitamin B12 transporter|uniref:TonB-dependent receptor plug domain-containing protein n=1 Tax=Sphingomonas sp. TaxID=28214 RepID=UPI002ED7BB49